MEKISVLDYIKNLPFFADFTESEKSSILELMAFFLLLAGFFFAFRVTFLAFL